jgi:Zn-dependent peptidase ImmA (M78 family)
MEPNYSLARQMAKKVIKDYKLTEVPTDLSKIFQNLGLKYIELDDPKDIDGAILEIDNKPSIAVLNKAKPIQRQRFTLAHELAHIFLHHKERDTYDPEAQRDLPEDVEQGKPPSEIEADAFASELLIPFDQIKNFEKEINNVEKIAGIFQVSKQAMTLAIMNYWKYSRSTRKKY